MSRLQDLLETLPYYYARSRDEFNVDNVVSAAELYSGIAQVLDDIDEVLEDVRESRSIDLAHDFGLDMVGDRVGVVRWPGETDDVFRDRIRFEIFRQESSGQIEDIKWTVAWYLWIVQNHLDAPITDDELANRTEDRQTKAESFILTENYDLHEPLTGGEVTYTRTVTRTDQQRWVFTFDDADKGFDSGKLKRWMARIDRFENKKRWTPTANAQLTAQDNELWLEDINDASTNLTEATFAHSLRTDEDFELTITLIDPVNATNNEKGVVVGGRYFHRSNGGWQVDSGTIFSDPPYREDWKFVHNKNTNTLDWYASGTLIVGDVDVTDDTIKIKSTGNSDQIARYKDLVLEYTTNEPISREVEVSVNQGLHDSGYEFRIQDLQFRFDKEGRGFDQGLFDVRVKGDAELEVIDTAFTFDNSTLGFDNGVFDGGPTVFVQQNSSGITAFPVPLKIQVDKLPSHPKTYRPAFYQLTIPWDEIPEAGQFRFDDPDHGFGKGKFDALEWRTFNLLHLLHRSSAAGVEVDLYGTGFQFDNADKGFDQGRLGGSVTTIWDVVETGDQERIRRVHID